MKTINDNILATTTCSLLIREINFKHIFGFIVRSLDAYPVIKKGYQEEVEKIKSYISRFKNLHPIGRSGMFKYNNQDHAIATGIYAARNLTEVNHNIDIWNINSEGVYLEGEAK